MLELRWLELRWLEQFLLVRAALVRAVLTRMHATTKCDTLGAGLIVVGVVLYLGFTLASLKALLILAFIWLTNPTAAHIIAKAVVQKDKEKL